MAAAGVTYIVAELIFLLFPLNGKGGDGSDELVVAKSLKSRGGVEAGAEGECQREAEGRVGLPGIAKSADLKCTRAQPSGTVHMLLIDQEAAVVRDRGGPGGRESGLLDEVVGGVLEVKRSAKEP